MDDGRWPRIGLLSTFPPRLCGLATFAAALANALERSGVETVKVAVGGRRGDERRSVADHVMIDDDPRSVRVAIDLLSGTDAVIVQHEYGIFAGPDGDQVLDLLEEIEAPTIVVLHTVPAVPTLRQREVLEAVCDLASRVVVMTEAARDRLLTGYDVEAAKVATIPHGASTTGIAARGGPHHPLHLLTWGLLGPGKGLEQVVRALALLRDVSPRVRCTIAGATHPNVFARDGDDYRHGLIRETWARGVAGTVTFDDTYRDLGQLAQLIASASVVVLPYDSTDQVTSGVLVDAIAAGRPVIATAFPHAVELLATGAGIVVPHRDPVALAAAIRSVAVDPELLEAMSAKARAIAPSLSWATVADSYRRLCTELAVEVAA